MFGSGEIVFFSLTLISLGSVLFAFMFGKFWLHTIVTTLLIITTFVAGKIIVIFGYEASIATPIYAGIFLATDALHEFYGKQSAKVAVWKGLFAMIVVTVLGQLIHSYAPLKFNEVGVGLDSVLDFIPSLFIGSACAYLVAQNIDIYLFGYFKKRYPNALIIRNNLSTIISQLIDSIIVYSIAFSFAPNLIQIISIAWLMKIFVAIVDTPILYIMKNYAERTPALEVLSEKKEVESGQL